MDQSIRLKMQKKLESALGSKNVYFQPPVNLALKYPCIVYTVLNIDVRHADNKRYISSVVYDVTLIHNDPDNDIIKKLLDLPWSSFDRYYPYENLHHYKYRIACMA